MKAYKDKMREALIAECTGMFDQTQREGKERSQLIIHFGIAESMNLVEQFYFWKLQEDSVETFLYSGGVCNPAPDSFNDAKDNDGQDYNDVSADIGYNDSGKAFVTIVFGPLFARCFEYDVVDDGESCKLTDGTLLWLS